MCFHCGLTEQTDTKSSASVQCLVLLRRAATSNNLVSSTDCAESAGITPLKHVDSYLFTGLRDEGALTHTHGHVIPASPGPPTSKKLETLQHSAPWWNKA